MAGHSKWANIKSRKGAQDTIRGKVFTKIIKEIVVAIKTGGGGDPDTNPRLRLAIQNAKSANMPKDNLQRAINKALGNDQADYIEETFEGYGSGGVAVFVEVATDNPVRTVANVRNYYNKCGGSLGKNGCLQFVFDRKGVFVLPAEGLSQEDFYLEMVEAGAEDIEFEDEFVRVVTPMEEFGHLQKKLEEMKLEAESAGLERVPITTQAVDAKTFKSVMRLVDMLEDDDDVQKVYHNIELTDELLESLDA